MRAHKTMIYQLLPGIVLPGLIYFIVASGASLNIGHRHILPVYPFSGPFF